MIHKVRNKDLFEDNKVDVVQSSSLMSSIMPWAGSDRTSIFFQVMRIEWLLQHFTRLDCLLIH